MEHLNDSLLPLLGNLHEHITLLANIGHVKDPDILGQVQAHWNHFVKTGQVWAMLIGIIVGYLFKGFTSYG